MECLDAQCVGSLFFRCHSCLDCGALHRRPWVPCEYPPCGRWTPAPPCRPLSRLTRAISWTAGSSTKCGTCLPGFYEHGNSCVSCPT